MRILLSGFEPFAEHSVNPSALIVERIQAAGAGWVAGHETKAVVLPVLFGEAFSRLEAEIRSFDPDVVIAMGLAAGRSAEIELERVAINCLDSEIADNRGSRLSGGQEIHPGGREAYFSTLPLSEIRTRLVANGIPITISNTAGAYVCNELFYRLQELTFYSHRRSGFIHLPLLQAAEETRPSLPLETLVTGIRLIATFLAEGSRS